MKIKDFKNYVKELKMQLEVIKEFDKDNILLINWYNKQIEYFNNKIKEVL